MQCIHCGGRAIKKGPRNESIGLWNWMCKEDGCGKRFQAYLNGEVPETTPNTVINNVKFKSYHRSAEYIRFFITSKKRIVVTSAMNNAEVDEDFFLALKRYMDANDAGLMVIPVRQRLLGKDAPEVQYDSKIEHYLIDNDIHFPEWNLKILSEMKLQPTAVNPLSAIDALSKGNSLIIGHPQLQMKTLHRGSDRKYPNIVTTTGSITKELYNVTKSGIKADFNHSMSAVVIEFGENEFFIRHLNYSTDEKCFYDLDKKYTPSKVAYLGNYVKAIVTGDSHVRFHDPEVYEATYGEYGLFAKLRPEFWIIHDALDFNTRSHHSMKDPFIEYGKHHSNTDNVEDELLEVCKFVQRIALKHDVKPVLVASNHDQHLDRWLKEADPKKDPENALIYHFLSFKILQHIKKYDEIPMALEVFWKNLNDSKVEPTFLKENESFKLFGIELGSHGHAGKNGAKGSARQFSDMADKFILGHSHCPSINQSCYQIGTSSLFDMGYNKGQSSWDHCHCIIHQNGKRQMVFLRNGKYKA